MSTFIIVHLHAVNPFVLLLSHILAGKICHMIVCLQPLGRVAGIRRVYETHKVTNNTHQLC